MAELMENTTPETAAPAFAETAAKPTVKKKRKKKTLKRIIAWVVVLALLGGGYYGVRKLLNGKSNDEQPPITDMVMRGAITSTVEGSGVAVAKNSESITLRSGGQVTEIFVNEGDYVEAGDALYTIDSEDARKAVNEAQKTVDNYNKELTALRDAANDLNVRAEYAGKITEVRRRLNPGDTIYAGDTLATLVDDTRMLLSLYFSYAYENDIYVGQHATVSIPAAMSQLAGTVHEIHKVQHISPEGSKFFEVLLVLDNPGTLTADMVATATMTGAGGTIYPYDSGALEYFRESALTAKVGGKVARAALYNDVKVAAGESLVTLTAEDNESEIAAKENQLKTAQKTLDEAQKDLDSLNAVAPISGTVLMLGIRTGEEARPGTVAVSIADTSTMIVNATVDEMNVAYVKPGMFVSVDQWGVQTFGTVESVSLTGQYENGVSRFPIVISLDNSEGQLMSGSYVSFNFAASQSDDCLVVPIQCVKYVETEQGRQKVLFVQADAEPENVVVPLMPIDGIPEGFYPVAVETGISDNYNVEILSGVEEMTTVFTSAARTSSGGMSIMF